MSEALEERPEVAEEEVEQSGPSSTSQSSGGSSNRLADFELPSVAVGRPEEKLFRHLLERDLLSPSEITLAVQEQGISGEEISIILVRNGFIRQADLTAAVLEADPELLYDDTVFVPSLPNHVLIETRTVMIAETDDQLYAGTLFPEAEVAERLREHDPRPVTFLPVTVEQIEDYMDDLERQNAQDDDSLVERIIRKALNAGVSDLHIEPRAKSYTILQRRLGVREHAHEGSLDEYHVLVARIKDRAKMDLSERRLPQDGSFQVEHRKRMVDLRIATTPTVTGEKVVVRLLDPDSIKPSLSTLGISEVESWRKGIQRSNGLCLICGPTGSGKTTTLNSSIRELDRIGKAVYSIEDPVEYQTPFVAQVNVNTSVGLDFSRGQRSFMRMDPDVILCGEIRDDETARNSIKGAETGHVMVATLHTSSIKGAASRLRDLGVEEHELRYILRTVLAQRLIRTFCKVCDGDGCKHCNHTGYGGRTIVSECNYFRDEDEVDRMLGGERWWPTMVEDAVGKMKQGLTDESEVIRVFGPEGEEAIKRLSA